MASVLLASVRDRRGRKKRPRLTRTAPPSILPPRTSARGKARPWKRRRGYGCLEKPGKLGRGPGRRRRGAGADVCLEGGAPGGDFLPRQAAPVPGGRAEDSPGGQG